MVIGCDDTMALEGLMFSLILDYSLKRPSVQGRCSVDHSACRNNIYYPYYYYSVIALNVMNLSVDCFYNYACVFI